MSAAERIKAAEAKRAAQRDLEAEAHLEQLATDLEALAALEDEHGFGRVLRVDLRGWRPDAGAATMVVARIPLRSESIFKRYEQTVSKGAKSGASTMLDAGEMLARSCIVYPSEKIDKPLYDATMELAPGVLSNVALQIIQHGQGQAEEEKKG